MYVVELNTDVGLVQIKCETLEDARIEEGKCLNKDPESERKFVEGVFDMRTFVACVNPEKRKDKDGNIGDFWIECTSCGKCLKRDKDSRLERFKAKWGTAAVKR